MLGCFLAVSSLCLSLADSADLIWTNTKIDVQGDATSGKIELSYVAHSPVEFHWLAFLMTEGWRSTVSSGTEKWDVMAAHVPGIIESSHMIDEHTAVTSIEWTSNASLVTSYYPPFKFKAFSPDQSFWMTGAVYPKNMAENELIDLSDISDQQTQLDLISVIRSMPSVVHFIPGEPRTVTLTSEFLLHKPLNVYRRRLECYKMRGGGSIMHTEFQMLRSETSINEAITESGDMIISITLSVSVGNEHDEGIYQCDFSKGGVSMMTSTLMIMETSTTYLPMNHDYIFMTTTLSTGDRFAKEGAPNSVTCKRISSVPGLPTLSLNGQLLTLRPSDMMLVSRESYFEQYVDYYIPAMSAETSGTYTCGSENGSVRESKQLISITTEDYIASGGVCTTLTSECLDLVLSD